KKCRCVYEKTLLIIKCTNIVDILPVRASLKFIVYCKFSIQRKNRELIYERGGNLLAINNLIVNGGFETGTFDGWSAFNTQITAEYANTGKNSTHLSYGASEDSRRQTLTSTPN